jgi:hypothetical protein
LEGGLLGHQVDMVECVGLRYERIWRVAVGLLATIGVVASLVLVAPATNVVTFLISAFTVGAAYLSLGLARELSSAELVSTTTRWAGLGGLVALAISGYAASAGLETVVLLGLIIATSPPVAVRLWPQLAEVATGKLEPRPRPSTAPSPRRTAAKKPPPQLASSPVAVAPPIDLPEPRYLVAVARCLCELSDEELCLAWRRSFKQLQTAAGADRRSAMADVRRAYLDELERRQPEAFDAWIASGARAAGDPARFFLEADH